MGWVEADHQQYSEAEDDEDTVMHAISSKQ